MKVIVLIQDGIPVKVIEVLERDNNPRGLEGLTRQILELRKQEIDRACAILWPHTNRPEERVLPHISAHSVNVTTVS
jgi:hypothetical protein